MQQVREIIQRNGDIPLAISEVMKRINKSATGITVKKEELTEILEYYRKL